MLRISGQSPALVLFFQIKLDFSSFSTLFDSFFFIILPFFPSISLRTSIGPGTAGVRAKLYCGYSMIEILNSTYDILHTKYDIRIRYLLYESKRIKSAIFQINLHYTAATIRAVFSVLRAA